MDINRRILSKILSDSYTVVEAANGREALDILNRDPDQVSAVLLDIVMPIMNGFETLKVIRDDARLGSIPVIMITGSEDEESRRKILALGANDFILKPYQPDLIRHCLRNNITFKEVTDSVVSLQRDKLTGLLNREAFFEKAQELISAHESGYYVLACLDVNKFKVLNDQYGTEKGDAVLKHIAYCFKSEFDHIGGLCCRVAADDFVFLFPVSRLDSPELEAIKQKAAETEGIVFPVTFSIGRYIVNDLTISPSAMYDRAMLAMASVKGRYDINIAIYDESMRKRLLLDQEIVQEMGKALEERQFEVWYQPQFNHSTGAMIGSEALVRWRHPEKGLVSPGLFIPVFESNGFIYQLDKFVWETVCMKLRAWTDNGDMPLPVSVNISRYDLLCPDVVDTFSRLLEKYSLPVGLLRLEITESAFSGSEGIITDVVRQLIELGFTLEIDDFGSGYSSLNSLKDVHAHILKLDMKFLDRENSQRGGNIIESVIRMAKWLGMAVIAEGVETIQQADFLRSIGCSYIQGYLYAWPMPEKQYEALFRETAKQEKLIKLETVDNLDNDSFWAPESMDTLIFNSFVGGACILEYCNGKIETIRASEKYAQVLSDSKMTLEQILKLKWEDFLDEENLGKVRLCIETSAAERNEVTEEFVFQGLPECPPKVYFRTSMRVIARTDDRFLVYCISENITERKLSEQKVRLLSYQMKAIMDNVDLGIVASMIKEEKSEFIFSNDRYYAMLGYTREQYSEEVTEAFRTIVPEDRARIIEISNLLRTPGQSLGYEFRCLCRDQSIRTLRCYSTCGKFPGYDEPALLSIFRDITDEKKVVEKQKELLDNLQSGVALYDFDGQTVSPVYLNRRYWELVGRNPLSEMYKSVIDAVHPDDKATVIAELLSAIAQKRDFVCDLRVINGREEYDSYHVNARIVPKKDGKTYSIYATYLPNQNQSMSFQEMLPIALSTVMSSSDEVAFIKDSNLRYICCSPAVVTLAGKTREGEILGKDAYEVFGPKLGKLFSMYDQDVLETGKADINKTESFPTRDGKFHYLQTSRYPIFNQAGELIGVYASSRDITKYKDDLDKLQLFVETVPGGLATHLLTRKDERVCIQILYFNEGLCELLGYGRAEFAGKAAIDPEFMIFDSDRHLLNIQTRNLMEEGTPVNCLYRVHLKKGGFKWLSHKSIISRRTETEVYVNSIYQDVTEQKNLTERVRLSEEENYLTIHQSSNLVGRYMVADRTLTMVSEMAASFSLAPVLTGVPDDPVKQGLISTETSEAYKGFFAAINHGSKSGTVIFQQKDLAGCWHWVEAKSSTIFSDDSEPVKAIISFQDITDKLEKEAIYRKWQQSMTERDARTFTLLRLNLSQNASIESQEGSLLYTDFKAELNRQPGLKPEDTPPKTFDSQITGYCSTWVLESDRDGFSAFLNPDTMLASYYRGKRSGSLDYREQLSNDETRWIRVSVDLIEYPNSTDIEAFLLFEDINEDKTAELKTRELAERDPLTGLLNRATFISKVTGAVKRSKPDSKHALFMLDIDSFKLLNDHFGHAAGDAALTELADFIKNSIRRNDFAGRLGGDEFVIFMNDIRHEGDAAAKARQICSSLKKFYSSEVVISISIGIAVIPHDGVDFAELYKKADNALYYVKHSGGDSFAFYRDYMTAENLLDSRVQTTAGNRRIAEKKRILIVDDNLIDSAIMKKIFENEFIVERANDGATAIISLRHYTTAISLVLLDLNMPVMDGFAVLETIQKSRELQEIPVIIVSGDESRESCLEAIRNGATDFITKPIDPELLKIRVGSAISRAENERLKAKNSFLEFQRDLSSRYEAALESQHMCVIEFDWLKDTFIYDVSVSKFLAGKFDDRTFWRILLSDLVADTGTVKDLQNLVHKLAVDKQRMSESLTVSLKTPSRQTHRFAVSIKKEVNDYHLANKLILTFRDLDFVEG